MFVFVGIDHKHGGLAMLESCGRYQLLIDAMPCGFALANFSTCATDNHAAVTRIRHLEPENPCWLASNVIEENS